MIDQQNLISIYDEDRDREVEVVKKMGHEMFLRRRETDQSVCEAGVIRTGMPCSSRISFRPSTI